MKMLLAMLIFISVYATGEPLVIRDYGGNPSGVPDKAKITSSLMGQSIKPVDSVPATRFPLKSSLRSGVLDTPKRFENKLLNRNPFFIVGNDERSREWIDSNKAYLAKIGAKGFVANIASEADFKSLESFAKPLRLSVIPLDEVVQSLELRVYPVLITNEEIAQ